MNNTFGNNSLDPFISMSTSFVLVFIIFLMIVKSCENVKKKCRDVKKKKMISKKKSHIICTADVNLREKKSVDGIM